MTKTYTDKVRLDFEVRSKGAESLKKVTKDLDKLYQILIRLDKLGNVFQGQARSVDELSKATKKAVNLNRQLASEVKKAGDTGSKSFSLFGENIVQVAKKINMFVLLTGSIIKLWSYAFERIKSVGELEEAMARTSTVTRATKQTLQSALFSIRTEVLKTARSVKANFTEIATSAYAAGSAGLTVADQIASIRPITNLVVATMADMEFTAKLVTGAFNVFGDQLGNVRTELEKMERISDIIADTYSRQQIELSELEAGFRVAGSAASLLDASFQEIVGTLGFLNTGLLKGSRAGTALMNAFVRLTKDADKLKEKFTVVFDPTQPLKFRDIIVQVADEIREGGVSAEEFRDLIDVFGLRGARAVAQIVKNMDRYLDSVDRSKKETEHMAEVLARLRSETLAASFQRMTNSLGETLVLLNDIFRVTGMLGGLFRLQADYLNNINEVLTPVAKTFDKVFGQLSLHRKEVQLMGINQRILSINKAIQKQSDTQGWVDIQLGKKLQKLEKEYAIQKKLVAILSGKGFEPKKEKEDTGLLSKVDSSALPKNVRKAVAETQKFIQINQQGLQLHGEMFKKQEEINFIIDKINEKVIKHNSRLLKTTTLTEVEKITLDKNLTLNKKNVKAIIEGASQLSKKTAYLKIIQELLSSIAKLQIGIAKNNYEITKSREKILLQAEQSYKLESLKAKKTRESLILDTKGKQIVDELNQTLKTKYKYENLSKKNMQEILVLDNKHKDIQKILAKLINVIYAQKLQQEKESYDTQQKADKLSLAQLKSRHRLITSKQRIEKTQDKEIADFRVNAYKEQISLMTKIRDRKQAEKQDVKAINYAIEQLNIKLREQVYISNEIIPSKEKILHIMHGYKNMQDVYLEGARNDIESAQIKLALYEQIVEQSKTDQNAQYVLNNLRSQGITLSTLELDIKKAQSIEAIKLAKAVNEGVKESLYESLVNAHKLDKALNNLGNTVGKIILKKQFDNLMGQVLDVFDVGAATVESQMGKGADTLITKLQTQLPILFSKLGDIIAARISQGKAATELGIPNIPGFVGPQVGDIKLQETIPTSQKGFKLPPKAANLFSGAMTGASLAHARNKDFAGQFFGGMLGGIGNMIAPGIGGLIGGLLGSFLGEDRETKEEKKPELFQLELSNTILKDINRNLTAIREDTTAFTMPSSFYFSAQNANPLGGVTINGDFNFQGNTPQGDFSIQNIGESVAQALVQEVARGNQA